MAKKKGLIEQLKSLIGLDKEPVLMGAMCYETHMPLFVTLKCELCGMEKEYDQFLMTEDEEIMATVAQLNGRVQKIAMARDGLISSIERLEDS